MGRGEPDRWVVHFRPFVGFSLIPGEPDTILDSTKRGLTVRFMATQSKGFSLIELLVVVGIIGVLMAIALPSYNQYLIKANQSAAKAFLLEVASREEQFLIGNGIYGSLTDLKIAVPEDVDRYFDITLATGINSGSTVIALQGMPTFTISVAGKAGTLQAGNPPVASPYSINQFGLKLPVGAW